MPFSTLRIASLELESNLVLAPMSGLTNSAFRRLIKSLNPGSLGLVVTEFVSVEGLTRDNKRSLQMLRFYPEERPIAVQIFGHDITRMTDAAIMVEQTGADVVDINCGCPVPKVVRRGGGCELMRQPEHLARLLEAVKKAISIPLTVKIRSGWDQNSINAVEIAKVAEASGVSLITVHGRTRKDLYRGNADWQVVEDVCNAVTIPVLGSGDVADIESATKALCGQVAGIMLGRAVLANPWLFGEIRAALLGSAFEVQSGAAVPEVITRYQHLLREELPERAILGRLKQLASQATKRIGGSALHRKAMLRSLSLTEFEDHLFGWQDSLQRAEDSGLFEVATCESMVDPPVGIRCN